MSYKTPRDRVPTLDFDWRVMAVVWMRPGGGGGVGPLEVRFAHPVRLSPDTHSQGHGRPCLQRLHPRRGFSATWSLLMVISFHAMRLFVQIKTFSTHVVAKIELDVSRKRFSTHERRGGHGSHGLGVALVSSAVSG